MTTDTLREQFLEFFRSKKHKIVSSDSLVPADDPTVLFTPAGMNQFKREFMGSGSGFKRAATSQRCLRTDDLDKVGKTSVHHTFFEMLGNFSFGDYFKVEAISWAWEFLTRELKISEDKLWVSVYKDDDEAYAIWKDTIKVPAKKILKLGDKDNFWPSEAKQKGPNGPCGPCSEIFFDFGERAGCGKPECDPTCSCGRYAEIWNLVFTQFNRKEAGILEPLPQKNIDTGMGLERLTAVMEGVTNNFETSLFASLVKEISSGAVAKDQKKEDLYAVADHIRAVTFCIYDGVLPSNEARGYIVRKLIRKSSLHLRSLGFKHAFLYKLIPLVASVMHGYYPDLKEKQENIAQIVQAEENNFLNTLSSSESLFKEKFEPDSKGGFDPEKIGAIAFELHDTYGIPFDLSKQWLNKHSIPVSEGAFEKSLQEQKNRSKLQSTMKGDVFDMKGLDLGGKSTQFLGYKSYSTKSKILKILKDNKEVKRAAVGEEVAIVLDKTPFYAESGGQVHDTGSMVKGKNCFEVLDTQKSGKVFVHTGKVKYGSFKKSDLVTAAIDIQRRLSIARNHTATHLLQAALRKVLGAHVQQQGSLVAPDRFRFDFTHFKGMDKDEIGRVESLVNEFVISNLKVESKEMALALAKKTGALAFFGEKYEGKVRVVTVEGVSKEFCGGTHLSQTGQIGVFKILQEGSVASGVRRIEGTTGGSAYRLIKEEEALLQDLIEALGVPAAKAPLEIQKRAQRIKELEKELNCQKLASMHVSASSLDKAEDVNGIRFVVKDYPDADMGLLRKAADALKNSSSSKMIGVLSSTAHNRINLVVVVSSDLCSAGVSAAELIKEIAPLVGGSGGGRPDFAQAGGSKPEDLNSAIQKCKDIITQLNR